MKKQMTIFALVLMFIVATTAMAAQTRLARTGQAGTADPLATWSERWTGTGSDMLMKVAYGDGTFVAVGFDPDTAEGLILTSAGGETWTRQTLEAGTLLMAVAYGRGTFVAAGFKTDTGDVVILTSPDGQMWTPQTLEPGFMITSIAYGDGTFVAVGFQLSGVYGISLTSPDGIIWTFSVRMSDAYFLPCLDVIKQSDGFVAVCGGYPYGSTGEVFKSPDGIQWSLTGLASDTQKPRAVAYGNYHDGLFSFPECKFDQWHERSNLAVNTSRDNLASYTTAILPAVTCSFSEDITIPQVSATFANNTTVVTSMEKIVTSTDGNKTWVVRQPGVFPLYGVAYGNQTFVAVGYKTILQSDPLPEAHISLSAASLVFENTGVSQSSAAQTITVTNTGTVDATIEAVNVAAGDTSDFSKKNDYCSGQVLATAATCTVDVVFSPASLGPKTGTLSIFSSDVNGTVRVPLAGQGVKTYTISTSSGANGTITPSGTVTVASGAPQSFAITPGPNYHVAGVVVDGVPVGTPTSYTFPAVSAGHTISATFAPNAYTVNALVSGGNGTVSPATQSITYGSTATIIVTPDTGYHVASIVDNGGPLNGAESPLKATASETGISYYLANVKEDHTIVVTFATTYTLTVNQSGNGSGVVTSYPRGVACDAACAIEFARGKKVTLVAKPATTSAFAGWSGGCSGTKSCIVTMDNYQTVTAFFVSEADITVTPARLSLGTVMVGKTRTGVITVKNSGKKELAISAVTIAGTDTSFTIPPANDACSGKTLAPARTCTIKPLFKPSSPGAMNAAVTILSNDPQTPAVQVNLTGTGTANPALH